MSSVLFFKAKPDLAGAERDQLIHQLASHQLVTKADWASERGTGSRGVLFLDDAADPLEVAKDLADVPGLARPPSVPAERFLIR